MYNRLYAAAITGILAARTKEAKEYSIVVLGKDAQDYAIAAILHWSNQIYQKQRLEKDSTADRERIAELEAEIVRLKQYYEERIVTERRVARLEGKLRGVVGSEMYPEKTEQGETNC
jgi:hypothetical protein